MGIVIWAPYGLPIILIDTTPAPSSAGGSSTTSYVNPTTSTTAARAETSMSRDRTIQPHHVQATSASRARTREPAVPSTARSQHRYQHSMQNPTNVNYLTFHVQSAAVQNPEAGIIGGGRRRLRRIRRRRGRLRALRRWLLPCRGVRRLGRLPQWRFLRMLYPHGLH